MRRRALAIIFVLAVVAGFFLAYHPAQAGGGDLALTFPGLNGEFDASMLDTTEPVPFQGTFYTGQELLQNAVGQEIGFQPCQDWAEKTGTAWGRLWSTTNTPLQFQLMTANIRQGWQFRANEPGIISFRLVSGQSGMDTTCYPPAGASTKVRLTFADPDRTLIDGQPLDGNSVEGEVDQYGYVHFMTTFTNKTLAGLEHRQIFVEAFGADRKYLTYQLSVTVYDEQTISLLDQPTVWLQDAGDVAWWLSLTKGPDVTPPVEPPVTPPDNGDTIDPCSFPDAPPDCAELFGPDFFAGCSGG